MSSISSTPVRSGLGLALKALALPALLLAVSLTSNRAVAGPFAATYFTPGSQTVNAGSQANVDLIFAVGTSYNAYGLEAWINFDPTILQVASITNGAGSPYSTVNVNTFDNTLGTIHFKATGGSVINYTLTAASIVFDTIGAGTSALDIRDVSQFISGYGPFGVNGAAVDGSITVVGSIPNNVPDSAQTLILLGSGLLSLGMLRRRLVRG